MGDSGLHDPLSFDGSTDIGVLVCHGFTGSPNSMREWANHFIAQGWSVRLPLLPGHGTSWQEANRTTWDQWYATDEEAFTELRSRCDKVFIVGLSMGGALALRLAETHGDDVAGLVLVNPMVTSTKFAYKLLPALSRVVPSVKALGNDIAKPGVQERAYDRTPVRALASARLGFAAVRADLGKVTQPIRIYNSLQDHVVEPVNGFMIMKGVSSSRAERIELNDSYHVATMDYDAPQIFEGSVEFIKSVAGA
jgi:carboxylesterase